jgi:5,10-methylenetetrahydromethanopterin reductase
VCFLYGAIDEDEAAALEAARPIAAWFPQTAPAYARLAGMSEELIEAVVRAYRGGEFQEAGAAAALIPDDVVRRMAFAGTPAQAERKLAWLREGGLDAVSIFPLGPRRRATIEAFAQVALTRA